MSDLKSMKATLDAILSLDAAGQHAWLETLLVRDQAHVCIIKAADVALESWEQTFAAHDEWCGHKKGSPGNGIFRDAQEATVTFRQLLVQSVSEPPETTSLIIYPDRIHCSRCHKPCSTEVPIGTNIRGVVWCSACLRDFVEASEAAERSLGREVEDALS